MSDPPAVQRATPLPGGRDPDDRGRLADLRAALPATRAGIYLNTGTAGPLPVETAAAMAAIQERELTLGRATLDAYEELLARMDEARGVVAAILGTDVDLVAITHSTTEGVNLALGTIDWRPGDRAVTTTLEHPAVTAPLALLRDRLGVDVVEAEIRDGGDDGLTLAALEAAAAGGRTRAFVASHGPGHPAPSSRPRRIAGLARRHRSPPACSTAPGGRGDALAGDEIGADFYALSGQKWLPAPSGPRPRWSVAAW